MQDLSLIVKEFYDSRENGDVFGVKKAFQKMILARDELAKVNFGEKNYIEAQVHKIHKIPEVDFQNYLDRRDAVIKIAFPGLEKMDEVPHFLNKLPEVDLDKDEIVGLTTENEELVPVLKNTEVEETAGQALFKYLPEQNSYKIEIPSGISKNQKIAILVHELSHVATHFLTDNKIESPYESEKRALELELRISKGISSEYYLANLRDYLMCFVRTDFQIDMFINPEQDPDVLYGKYLRQYLGEPTTNFTKRWQFEEKVVEKPLSDLPYAVAVCNLTNQK